MTISVRVSNQNCKGALQSQQSPGVSLSREDRSTCQAGKRSHDSTRELHNHPWYHSQHDASPVDREHLLVSGDSLLERQLEVEGQRVYTVVSSNGSKSYRYVLLRGGSGRGSCHEQSKVSRRGAPTL